MKELLSSTPVAQLGRMRMFSNMLVILFFGLLQMPVFAQPAAPTLILPKPGAVLLPGSVTFTWNSIPNASAYHLQVSSLISFNTTLYDSASILATSATVTGLPANTQLYWRVRAFDNIDSTAWTAAGSLYLLNPRSLGSMQLWVRGDSGVVGGSAVSSWQDYSGNNASVIQADANRRPTKTTAAQLNNLPVLKFDGTDFLDGGQSLELGTNDQTILIIFNSSNLNGQQYRLIQKRGHTTNTDGWCLAPRGSEWNSSLIAQGSNSATFQFGCCMNDGNYRIVNTIWDNSDMNWDMYINGQFDRRALKTGILNGADIVQNFNKIMTIGCSWNSPTDLNFFLNGNIAEIMVYHTALDSAARNVATQYLRYKYSPPVDLGADILNSGFCDITLTALKPYFKNYFWYNAAAPNVRVNADTVNGSALAINTPGTYKVRVRDIFGFTSEDEVTISNGLNTLGSDTVALCFGDTLVWDTQLSSSDYAFQWQDGSTGSSFTIRNAGAYWVEATDSDGCSYRDSVFVIVNPCGQCAASYTYFNVQNDYSFQNTSVGDSLSYLWDFSDGNFSTQENPVHTYGADGNYQVCLYTDDSLGCRDTICNMITVVINQDLVWPGDANYDGIANNQDLLAIGIGYGISGFNRPNATTNWVGQPSPDWQLQLAGGANLKHVDCDGNAVIDSNDVPAISLNYGLTHSKGSGAPEGRAFAGLFLVFPQDSFFAGDTVSGELHLGVSASPLSNIYGLAFSIRYDQNLVDSNSFRIDFINSWMAPDDNRISLTKDLYLASKMDAGVSRIDHTNISGAGKIANVSFVIQDNIDGKDFLTVPLEIQFENVLAIDKDEATVSITADGDTLYLKQEITGMANQKGENALRIFPNPVADAIFIEADFLITEYSLLDITGKEIMRNETKAARLSIDVQAFSSGAYFLVVKDADHFSYCRKMIVRK